MNNAKNVPIPKIRFSGFLDEWQEASLGSKVEFYSGLTYSPISVQKQGGTLVLRSSNVKRGEIIDADNVYVDSTVVNSKNVEIGDVVVVVRNGSRSLIGKHAQIKIQMENTVIGAFMTGLTSKVPSFTNALLDTTRFDREIAKNLGATINQITTGLFREMRFSFPPPEEKLKIGEYFSKIDKQIELLLHKHKKLTTLKQAMMQKMFPKKGCNTPEVRFSGYTSNWQTEALGKILCPIPNNTLSRACLNQKSGIAKNIHYGDILVKFGEVIDVPSANLPFISNLQDIGALAAAGLSDGDIIVADAAEDTMVGKCSELVNVGETVVLAGLHTIALRPLARFAPAFLGYFMNSNAFHDQLIPLMQGTKVLSISKSALKDTELFFPSDWDEQRKIGAYFRQLDNLITLQATQLKKLKQIKLACLEKMFV